MSQGKYSPNLPTSNMKAEYFNRNAMGDVPPSYNHAAGEYDPLLHFDDYDPDGFDSYGYSAFDTNGNFVGHGQGVDRNGYTEMEYLTMDENEFLSFL